jgi:hypothetical protein
MESYKEMGTVMSLTKCLLLKLLPIPVFFFFLLNLTSPLHADDSVRIPMYVKEIIVFQVNNISPLTYTYNSYDDFGVAQDIGDIDYDLEANSGWQVDAIILDGVQNGQTSDNWDDSVWTLTVNGVAIDESTGTIIDSDPSPVNRAHARWHVFLTIPWPQSPSTPDCTIEMTASAS